MNKGVNLCEKAEDARVARFAEVVWFRRFVARIVAFVGTVFVIPGGRQRYRAYHLAEVAGLPGMSGRVNRSDDARHEWPKG